MSNEELLKEFKLFREQVYTRINEFEAILRNLNEVNSDDIDTLVKEILGGASNAE